ncbi:hypothetical protein BT96DRAFT_919740 [Gymnopus androsaceus JB14]|uniref:F-box domain-containing protein n=1 Tax=Gymnopus androsaceus JB14 TaxID=1447944 RepID=A0A6A4HPD8_9AGAR|nr:hypothetical protein BT96DRAFT_919740 [Gymnopus androsaceus JB14]
MSHTLSERQFPIEIFATLLIFSQSHLFRHIDLISSTIAGSQFVGVLSDPRTSSLGRYVRRLDFAGSQMNIEDDLLILQSLTFLTEIRLHKGRSEHFHAIRNYLGGQLQKLWVSGAYSQRSVQFQELQSMLASLTVLKFLSIGLSSIWAQGLGLEIYSPMLRTLLVDFHLTFVAEPGPKLWKWLRPETMVVIDVGTGYIPLWARDFGISQVLDAFISGFQQSQVTVRCSQFPALAYLFALFVCSLPDAVREISIEFNVEVSDVPTDCDSHLEDWDDWDRALIKRYEAGSLNRVWFICTSRMISWDRPSTSSDGTPGSDYSTLVCVRKLLPQSYKAGIIEVDHSSRFLKTENAFNHP